MFVFFVMIKHWLTKTINIKSAQMASMNRYCNNSHNMKVGQSVFK